MFSSYLPCSLALSHLHVLCGHKLGNLSGWDISGDWKVQDGGHGTEKAFATSFMACAKTQVVDLTQQFSTEYLDKAPSIQVGNEYILFSHFSLFLLLFGKNHIQHVNST